MSRRQKLVVAVSVGAVCVVIIIAAVAWQAMESLSGLGSFLRDGYLGQEGHRQRIEVPRHGFAVSFSDDWTIATPPSEPEKPEQTAMIRVLTSSAPNQGPDCSVDVAPGAAATPSEQVIRALSAERGIAEYSTHGRGPSEWDLPDGSLGFAFQNDSVSPVAGWVVPLGDDAIVLSCVFSGGPDGLMALGLVPVAGSLETLPDASPSPTPRVLGVGGRVEMVELSLALTFPDGWVIIEPGAEDYRQAVAVADPLDEVPELRTARVAGARPPASVGGSPAEWCRVDVMTFPPPPVDDWIRWNEDASLEDIVTFLYLGSDQRPDVAYLDVPAGPAARISGFGSVIGTSDEAAPGLIYLLRDGNDFTLLACDGVESATDAWLSIAQTLESLPS